MEKKFLDEMGKIMPKMMRVFARQSSNLLTKGAVTLPQMVLLEIINEKGMAAVGQIAREMNITKGAVTGLTDRLVKSKFITRTRGIKDRRIVLVALTEKGKNAIKKLLNERIKMFNSALSVLTVKEQETYLGLVKKISKGFINK